MSWAKKAVREIRINPAGPGVGKHPIRGITAHESGDAG
jgi:hypothetical protein